MDRQRSGWKALPWWVRPAKRTLFFVFRLCPVTVVTDMASAANAKACEANGGNSRASLEDLDGMQRPYASTAVA